MHTKQCRHFVFHAVEGNCLICFQHKLFYQLHGAGLVASSDSNHLLVCIKLKDFFRKAELHRTALNSLAFKYFGDFMHSANI